MGAISVQTDPSHVSRVSLRGILIMTVVSVCCWSCSANPGRSPGITLLDFRTQNMERLHSGMERLLGGDSAGRSAMEYVRAYEDDLLKYFPSDRLIVAPEEPVIDLNDCINLYGDWVEVIQRNSARPIQGVIKREVEQKQFVQFLAGRRLGAIAEMRKSSEEFAATGNSSSVKMGIATAYAAVESAPSPNEIKIIADAVGPMLEFLTRTGRTPAASR